MAGLQLRMRMVTLEPGGVFGPMHDHKGRPGTVYVLQGTITDHRDGVATDYGPGVGWPEDRNPTHWLEHRGTRPAVGRDGFPPGFSAPQQQSRFHCIRELEAVAVVGEAARTVSRNPLSVPPRAGGEAIQLAGHRLTVYRQQPDGRWLLARDAHTLSPMPNPAS